MAAFTILDLHARIAAVCPILGVSAGGAMNDRTRWTVAYAPDATDAQKAAALVVITSAPPLTPPEGC